MCQAEGIKLMLFKRVGCPVSGVDAGLVLSCALVAMACSGKDWGAQPSANAAQEGRAVDEAVIAKANAETPRDQPAGAPGARERRTVDESMIAKANALAETLRDQAAAASGPHGYYFSPEGKITGEFVPVLKQRPGVRHAPTRAPSDAASNPASNAASEVCGQSNWGGKGFDAAQGTQAASAASQVTGFPYFTDVPTILNPDPPQQQQVKYVGTDNHVYETFFTPGRTGWDFNDLTNLSTPAGATMSLAKGPLVGFQTVSNRQQHVMYIGTPDNDIHELFFDGTTWHHRDLTSDTSSMQPAPDARQLVGFVTTFNQQEHIDYVSADGHVRELFFAADQQWHPSDLSQQAFNTAPTTFPLAELLATTSSAIVGYETAFNSQQHIDFINALDHHIFELAFEADQNWHPRDLTNDALDPPTDATAPPPDPASALDGYPTAFNQQQHVDFIDANTHHVWELALEADQHWHPTDLTAKSNAPAPNPASPLVGYQTTFNSQQHVDFIDGNGDVQEMFFANNNWLTNDLSVQTGLTGMGVKPSLISLAGYQSTGTIGQQHVDLIASDPGHLGHVFEMFINNGDATWHTPATDLTGTSIIPFVNASASWHVPRVSQPLQDSDKLSNNISLTDNGWDSSTWVGIDGHGQNDVLQAGTRQTLIDNDDKDTQYVPWFEWFPDSEVDIFIADSSGNGSHPMPEAPGDVFTTNIFYVGNSGVIVLTNVTAGVLFTTTMDPPDGADHAGKSIEWIMETPCEAVIGTDHLSALPAFTPVVFTQATGSDAIGRTFDPNAAAAFTTEIPRTDFLGPRINLTHSTSPGPNQVTVDFVDWYDHDLTKLADGTVDGAPPPANGRLVGFQTTFNNQQHVIYIGNDSHVHEVFFPNSANKWEHRDLTVRTGAPAVLAGSSLTGYQSSSNGQQHVDFIDANNRHIFELWFDTNWHPNDLTLAARNRVAATPNPVPTTALNGFTTDFDKQQHIDFIAVIGGRQHVNELWHDDAANTWNWVDLTATARMRFPNTPDPVAGTSLDGYATNHDSQQHVNFIGLINGVRHVQELWHAEAPNTWNWNDLTAAAPGATIPNAGTSLDGFYTSFNRQQHVNFVGPGNQVGELFYLTDCVPSSTNTCWRFSNPSIQANVLGVQARLTALDGYPTDFNTQEHVNFLSSADNDVRELFFTDHWEARDLTSIPWIPNPAGGNMPGAVPAAAGSKLTGYQTTNNQEHVDYVDGVGDVHELIHGP